MDHARSLGARRSGQTNSRRGFTLIELMMATALAGLLMVALMGVVGSLSKHARLLREKYPDEIWKHRLSEQLRREFANARQWQCTPERLTLVGFGGHSATGEPSLVPARVHYYLHREGERTWLMRRETRLSELTNQNHETELVAFGVTQIEVEVPAIQAGTQQPAATPADPGAVGERMRVVLHGGQDGNPIFDELIVTR